MGPEVGCGWHRKFAVDKAEKHLNTAPLGVRFMLKHRSNSVGEVEVATIRVLELLDGDASVEGQPRTRIEVCPPTKLGLGSNSFS